MELDLVNLLHSQIEPQVQAKELLDAAVAGIEDEDSQRRFLLLTLHICLAASRHQIRLHLPGEDGTRLADDFERLVISQTWDCLTGITEANHKRLFRDTESSIGDLGHPGSMEDVGLTLLSLACSNPEECHAAAVSAGMVATLMWDIAATTTERYLPDRISFEEDRRIPDKLEYIKAMVEMAAEAERTYRGMIDTYNADIQRWSTTAHPRSPVVPTGRGLYKARLFGALFMVSAYARSAGSEDDTWELLGVATGLALEPLQGQDEQCFDREEARSLNDPYLTPTFKAIVAASGVAPFLPGAVRPEHQALADQLHEALSDSIGSDLYTEEVRGRFAHTVLANTALTTHQGLRWTVE